jgi:hypothetical protein
VGKPGAGMLCELWAAFGKRTTRKMAKPARLIPCMDWECVRSFFMPRSCVAPALFDSASRVGRGPGHRYSLAHASNTLA